MSLYRYIVTLKHDTGKVKITTIAENKKEAIEKICCSEKAPICAAIEVKRKGVILKWK